MFEFLNGFRYSPADMEVATRGHFTISRQRKAVAEGRFLGGLIEPKAGKPREWRLVSVYQAAAMAAGIAHGMPIEMMQQAIERRLRRFSHGDDGSGFLRPVSDLPEFQVVDRSDPSFWVIYAAPVLGKRPGVREVVGVERLESGDQVGHAMMLEQDPKPVMVSVFNVTEVLAGVNEILSERLRGRAPQ